MARAEADSLLDGKTTISLFGVDAIQNDEPWQFVMVFPLPVDGDPYGLMGNVESPIETWKAIFPRSGAQERPFEPPITKKEFIDLVRAQIEKILTGDKFKCKLESFNSIDRDESFLTIWLQDTEMLETLAERVEARARVKPSAYEMVGFDCPTEYKNAKEFTTMPHEMDADKPGQAYRNLHTGEPMDNSCPAWVLFRKELKDKLDLFEEPQVLRVLRRHMLNYINIEELQKVNAITNFFAVHKWRHLSELHRRGWNDLSRIFGWPKEGTADHIVQYAGIQAAFFFHLFNTFTRWISGPAVLSVINFVLRRSPWVDKHQMQMLDSAYGAMLCIWTTVFLVRYEQLENLKIFRWGMHGAEQEIAPVRKEFSDAYRGTVCEGSQNLVHWILCLLFMLETVVAAECITKIRSRAFSDPEGSTFGISNGTLVLLAKYAITLNIKLVDSIWTPLSTWLSKKENWRTETDLKANMVVKLFAVKFVVFYYPFAFTIFVQPYEAEGCDGGEMSGCVSKLRSDLYFFFVCQVVTEAVGLCVTLLSVYWSVRSEKKKISQESGRKHVTYLELQAKLPPYGEADQIADYMNLVLIFGFIAMFGVTCPSMSIMCFFSNFPIKRLLAYKVSYARQRAVPRVEEGIGAWRAIMSFIAYMGVTCTCYIVIFVFNIEKMSLATKLILFILAERVLMALKKAMEGLMGSKTVAQLRIQEHNEEVLDKVLNGDA